jgi:hypothetical protein
VAKNAVPKSWRITPSADGRRWSAWPLGDKPQGQPGDTQAPTISITSPTGGTVSGTVTVQATASDNVGVVRVQFLLDGANLGAEDTSAPYSVQWNTNWVANGQHTLSALAWDAAGNMATSDSVSVLVSNTAGSATILWSDNIQAGSDPWGFDWTNTEHPIGTTVAPSDANGANLSRVADPLGGGGYALRLYGNLDSNGARAEADVLSFVNSIFNSQAKSPEGIWVAQQWYFPQALSAGSDDYPWINLWDWHSTNASDRWHTSPAIMPEKDGTMQFRLVWGGGSAAYNNTSGVSSIALPVGQWFDVEMHYAWTSTNSATISVWINGALAIEQTNCRTRDAAHTNVEMNAIKLYGTDQGHTPWTPNPVVMYRRNIRFAASKIT